MAKLGLDWTALHWINTVGIGWTNSDWLNQLGNLQKQDLTAFSQQNWLLEKILQLKVNNKLSLLLLIYLLQDGIMLLPPTENVTLHYNLPLRQNLECEGPKFTVLDQAKNVKKNNFHFYILWIKY